MSSMLGWVTRGLLLATGVSGAAYASSATGGIAWVGTQLSGAWPQQIAPSPPPAAPSGAPALPSAAYDPFLGVIEQWRRIQQTDGLPFSDYANFMLAHPGWPGETARRAIAETTPDAGAAPGLAVRFFDRFPPLTATGRVRYAEGLAASGRLADAAEQARRAWRMGALRPADETKILSLFPAALSLDDHDARMDMLLWQNQTGAAARQLAWTSAQRRPLFEARLAYRTGSPDAAGMGEALSIIGANDAGYLADRATWMRNSGGLGGARSLLARPHAIAIPPGSAEKWYEVLLANARAAAADGQYSLAYDIARQVDDAYPVGTDVGARPLGERDDYTSLTWLAGGTAMRDLGRPRDAVAMFDRYARGSKTATTQSKGLYWAGRAAEAAGDRALADGYYGRAAGFSDLYYGQLAAERLSQPLRRPAPIGAAEVDPAVRAAFAGRETVRAARLLGSLGRYDEQSLFLRQIAADATTDRDHLLAAELSRTIDRPDLGVMVGRSALQNGLTDYTAAGYPSVRVPVAASDNWTIVHAIARQESQFNRTAISHAGARGLMQLMPGTARESAGKLGLGYNAASLTVDTDYNIQLGSAYFSRMYALYGSYPLAVAAYNAGPGNVNKWLAANGDPRSGSIDVVDWVEKIPIFETKNYVQRVLENAVVYDLMNPEHARSRGPANLSWYLGKNRPG